jgi:hypothetical protein
MTKVENLLWESSTATATATAVESKAGNGDAWATTS